MKTDEKSLEMSLRSKSGVTVVVKSDNHANKTVWANAFEAQIEVLANRIASAARPITAEEKALTISYDGDKETGVPAGVRNVVIPSVAVKEAEMFANSGMSSPGGDNHHLTSPFNNYKMSESLAPHVDAKVTPIKLDTALQLKVASPGSTGRPTLISFVSSPKLMTDVDDVDHETAQICPPSPLHKVDPSSSLVEFITEDDDMSTDEGKSEDDFVEGENDEPHDALSKINLVDRSGSESTDIDGESGAISALEGADSPGGKGDASPTGKIFRPKSMNFGCQPEKIVSHTDFDVAPELLTTAQKVAILESAAYQYRTNQQSIQPREPRKSFIAAPPSVVSPTGDIDGYTPTGLRLDETDKQETQTENDGGAVAKTQDSLKNKISKWEGWSKEKASPVPPTKPVGK